MTIDQLREKIDELDERLVELLNERASCALRIGEIKQTLGLEIYQPDRESQVLGHVRKHGVAIKGPLSQDALTRLFERIIDEARRLERESAHTRGHETPPGGRAAKDWRAASAAALREIKTVEGGMVVVMQERASEEQIEKVVAHLVGLKMDVHRSTGVSRTVLGAVGDDRHLDPRLLEMLDGVSEVMRVTEPYKLASRAFKPEGTVVSVGEVRIGGDEVIVMAGPCSAETEEQVNAAAAAVKKAGAKILRGGAFKPRSSPYSFQGLGEDGLRMLRAAANQHDLKLVSEVMDVSQIELIEKYCDMFQVGARNMQNYTLLRELGHQRKPVLLKRGIAATIEEWLLSAEYILAGGNGERRALRARHPHVRELHAQHAGHLGDPGRQEAEPPADRRRPQPRDGPPRQGRADGARGGCRGRRRADHRSPLRPRPGAQRRRAVDVPRAVRSAHGRTADHRAGHRPDDLSRAGDAKGMELGKLTIATIDD